MTQNLEDFSAAVHTSDRVSAEHASPVSAASSLPISDLQRSTSVAALEAGRQSVEGVSPPRAGDPGVIRMTLHTSSRNSPRKAKKDMDRLRVSMAELGLLTKLQLNTKHEGIDCRHRLEIMTELGLATRDGDGWLVRSEDCEIHDDDDAQAYRRSAALNTAIRKVSAKQAAMMAADTILGVEKDKGERVLSVDAAAAQFTDGVSRNIHHCLNIRREDTELAELILNTPLSINKAVHLMKPEQRAERDLIVALSKSDPEALAARLRVRQKRVDSFEADPVADLFAALPKPTALAVQLCQFRERVERGDIVLDDARQLRNLLNAVRNTVVAADRMAVDAMTSEGHALIATLETITQNLATRPEPGMA